MDAKEPFQDPMLIDIKIGNGKYIRPGTAAIVSQQQGSVIIWQGST
jgi:hypothetical protein